MRSRSANSEPSKREDSNDENEEDAYQRLDADKLLEAFGKYGRYQVTGYMILQALNTYYSASMFLMPFIQKNPMFCNITDFDQPFYELSKDDHCYLYRNDSSRKYLKCGSKEANGSRLITVQTHPVGSMLKDYDIGCSNPLWKEAGLSAFTIGALIVVPFMAYLSDRHGRRPILLISVFISVIVNIATPFMPNFYLFLVGRFIVGAMSDTYLTIGSIHSCELVTGDGRLWSGPVYTLTWVLGYFYVGVVAYYVAFASQWKLFYLTVVLPGVITITMYWLIPESPHWLITHGKVEGIKKYIQKAEKFNNTTIDLGKCQTVGKEVMTASRRKRRKSIWRVLKNKTVVVMLLINGFITLVHQMYYFTLTFTSVDLSQNEQLGFFLSGLVEIPPAIIVLPLMHYFGRRFLTVTSLILQGVFIAVCPYATRSELEWVKITFNLLGKFANSIVSVTHPLLISEMMPTTVRTTLFSIINIPQSIGILIAPYVKYLIS
ncbi:hypothetical protein L596_011813 [Steinernema carpocapsae]|uniref:Major facilitator superfamily (MFS) profile domain-containing protein n=1 Tax=Steinernema carpocapsae TaxID=34508 RepID=A0A4U5NVK5_STECR|nr:hypothetical protein L596_011813 [Steinernema carpocapsae]